MRLFRSRTPTNAAPSAAVAARDRGDARRQEDDKTLWQDYHAFLGAKRTLAQRRIAEAQVAFERADDLEAEAERAQRTIDRIPAGIRTMFEYVLEERRQEIAAADQGRRDDPDAVEQTAIEQLLSEAMGEVATDATPRGYGWFPKGTAGDIKWYALDVRELLAAPTAATYQVGTEQDSARAGIVKASIAGVLGIVFLVVYVVMPRGSSSTTASDTRIPVMSGASASGGATVATPVPMDTWPLRQATIGGQQVMVAATTARPWPEPDTNHAAYWQQYDFLPLRLCIASDRLDVATSITLHGERGWPDRVYSLSATAGSTTALVLEACTGTAQPRYGTLQQTVPLPAHAVGERVPLPDETTLTVQDIAITSAGQDASVPGGQARVTVTVTAPAARDWPAYAPTLVLPAGQSLLPAEIVAHDGGTELRYLMPLPTESTVVAWDIAPPNGPGIRWRTTLRPPPDRSTVLRDAVAATVAVNADQLAVTITNRSARPFSLFPGDVMLVLGDQPQTLELDSAALAPLAPGEQRSLLFSAPSTAQDYTVAVGPFAYHVTPN